MQYVSHSQADWQAIADEEDSLPPVFVTMPYRSRYPGGDVESVDVRDIARNGVKRPLWTRHDDVESTFAYDPSNGVFTMSGSPRWTYDVESGSGLGWGSGPVETSSVVLARTETRTTRSRKGRSSFVPTARHDHTVTTGRTSAVRLIPCPRLGMINVGHDWEVPTVDSKTGEPIRLTDTRLDSFASAFTRYATGEGLPATLDYRGQLRRSDSGEVDLTDHLYADRAQWAGLTGGKAIDATRMFIVPANVSHGIIPESLLAPIGFGTAAIVPHTVDAASPLRDVGCPVGPDDAMQAARASRDGDGLDWPRRNTVRRGKLPSVIAARCPVVARVIDERGRERIVRGETVGNVLRLPSRLDRTVTVEAERHGVIDARTVWHIGTQRVLVAPLSHGAKSVRTVKAERLTADILDALSALPINGRTTVGDITLVAPTTRQVRNGKVIRKARRQYQAWHLGGDVIAANLVATLTHRIVKATS